MSARRGERCVDSEFAKVVVPQIASIAARIHGRSSDMAQYLSHHTWCRGEGEFREGDRLSTPWAPLKTSALWLSASTNHERPARPRGAAMSASVRTGTR